MRKIGLLVLAVATAMLLTLGSGSAVAQEPFNKSTCEAVGGTWISEGSFKECQLPEETSDKNEKFQCQETISGGPGNLKPQKDTETVEMTDDTGSGKCPPGQFPA
jgi:hypothetical protein